MNRMRSRSAGARAHTSDVGARAGRAVAAWVAAGLLLAGASGAAAATTLRTGPLFASDGDILTCSVVNWDTKPRAITARIVLVIGGAGEVENVTCNPTVPLASCIATESVLVPIVGSGFFACEILADGPRSKFRGVLENVTTGRNVAAQ